MKAWIVNHYAWPPSGPGSSRHHCFAKNLLEYGNDINLIVSNYNHFNGQERPIPRKNYFAVSQENGVKYVWLRVPKYKGNTVGRLANMLQFSRNLEKFSKENYDKKPDVILGSTLTPFAALSSCRIAERLRIPFVLEVRDLWPQTLIDIGSFPALHPFVIWLKKIEKELYRKSNHIITLLPKAHEHIQTFDITCPISWIPNGVDLSQLATVEPVLKPSSSFNVLYAGSMGLANALDDFIDAAISYTKHDKDRKINFHLLGDGPERKRLEAKCNNAGAGHIKFLGIVPKREVFNFINQADCCFISILDSPLYKFGYSMNKIYDYMASSKPIIIATNAEYNPIEEAEAGLTIPPESSEKIKEAISALFLMSPEARRRLGENGRRYVEQFHDLNHLALRLEKLLNATISHKER